MPDTTPAPTTANYAGLGFVANPFPPIDESSTTPLWLRLVAHAASNGVVSAVLRSSASGSARPLLVRTVEDVPDYYWRFAQNDFLSRSAGDPNLSMMSLNIPLDMMRLGRIRGTLAELAELVAAADLPATAAAYFAATLGSPDESALSGHDVTEDEVAEAVRLFVDEPRAAVARYLGAQPGLTTSQAYADEDDALHEAYLRQVGQDVDPDPQQEGDESDDEDASAADSGDDAVAGNGAGSDESEPPRDPDLAMRAYLLERVRTDLSPVVARALGAYEAWGDGIVAQELKVTKAPRKTLGAVLRFMSHRWKRVVVLYDSFDAWPIIEPKTKTRVLLALTELRWIIGETGVMGLLVIQGQTPEIEEQFAGAEQVDWSMTEIAGLYDGDYTLRAETVQRWLDAAALEGVSPITAGGPELAPLVEASDNDILRFALMAEAAFRSAAERGANSIDEAAVAAGIASVSVEDGA